MILSARGVTQCCVLALGMALLPVGQMAWAQAAGPKQGKPIARIQGGGVDKDALPFSQARLVQGTVYGPDEKVLTNAQVYLKDETTSDVRTMLTNDKGGYQFGELPMTHDYKVWADAGGTKSLVKPVSSFVETRQVTVNLRMPSGAPAAAK